MQDPVLAKVKLIAEPWDLGVDGYQLGSFPPGWSEWNDRFRDTVRRFWRGESGLLSDLAYRLTGSSDVFGWSGRGPTASVNYVTAHDGFTLEDLVSYAVKTNEPNSEGGRDGAERKLQFHLWRTGRDNRRSRDQGDPRSAKAEYHGDVAAFAGLPMILGGDELVVPER